MIQIRKHKVILMTSIVVSSLSKHFQARRYKHQENIRNMPLSLPHRIMIDHGSSFGIAPCLNSPLFDHEP